MKIVIYLIAFLIGFNYGKTSMSNHTYNQQPKTDDTVKYCSNYVYDYHNKVDVSEFCEISKQDLKE